MGWLNCHAIKVAEWLLKASNWVYGCVFLTLIIIAKKTLFFVIYFSFYQFSGFSLIFCLLAYTAAFV